MHQDLIDAVDVFKSAADRLLELVATGPIFDFSNLDERQRESLRSLINPWLEEEHRKQLARYEELMADIPSHKDIKSMVEEEVEKATPDMGGWNEVDPYDVQNLIQETSNVDFDELKDASDKLDDYATQDSVDAVGSRLETIEESLAPVLEMIKTIREKARFKSVG